MIGINGNSQRARIVGVVKDFYNHSFREDIEAICIYNNLPGCQTIAVKLNPANVQSALPAIEKIWNETYPDYVYSYSFLDDNIRQFYELDNIMLKLVQWFAVIAVLIGCLGLYGLVSYMAIRKTKEIGVRKVLGAGTPQLLWLFGREFTRLLLVAFLVAAPLAWWMMSRYLQDFKYRISIGPGIFILSILITFLVAACTVGYRSLRAARANPVKSLRTE
jgi:ABC-type antimicrobial peptide transport system permease subunit